MGLLGYCTAQHTMQPNIHSQVTGNHLKVSCIMQQLPTCQRQRHTQYSRDSRAEKITRWRWSCSSNHSGNLPQSKQFCNILLFNRKEAEGGALSPLPPPVFVVDDDIKTHSFAPVAMVALHIVHLFISFFQGLRLLSIAYGYVFSKGLRACVRCVVYG